MRGAGVSRIPAVPDEDRAPTPLIALRDVSKTYRNKALAVDVLKRIDLDIYEGEFVAIMGPSGSGKSTLLHILGCLDRPCSGSYRYEGRDISRLSGDGYSKMRSEEFGFVFQNYHLIETGSALENVEVPGLYTRLPASERRRRAMDLLKGLGLGDRLNHRPPQLSGGQQQRASIARALMTGGRVILADEPTGALDTQSGADIMARLDHLSALGHTIILVTHDAAVAAHASRVIQIRDGAIVSDSGARPCAVRSREHAPQPAGAVRSAFFDVRQAARIALRSLMANVFRSVLTLLGIVIGVGAIIAMMAVGDGAKQAVLDRIESMGSNLMVVRPGAPNQRGAVGADTLVVADAEAIKDEVPNILGVLPEQYGTVTVRWDNISYSTGINGTSSTFPEIRQWPVSRGQFFNETDEERHAAVAVLGDTVTRALFPGGQDPLGQYILIDNVLFQVIGVMAPKGASPYGIDQDDVIFLPYGTGSMRLTGKRALSTITIAVDDVSRLAETEHAVLKLLFDRHRVVDFAVRNMAEIIAATRDAQNTLTLMLGSIAAISLVVGGIGVMNIMLVTVTERTREIGIRMAVGAREMNIKQQFLIEAVTISMIGGLLGVTGGAVSVAVIDALGVATRYSLSPMGIAFGCALLTGLVAGVFPAWRAARLDPVSALASG